MLRAVASGLANAEIADDQCTRLSTVTTHVAALMRELHVRNRVEIVIWAHGTGRVTRWDPGAAMPVVGSLVRAGRPAGSLLGSGRSRPARTRWSPGAGGTRARVGGRQPPSAPARRRRPEGAPL